MWKIKELKSGGRKSLKANYGRAIAVCFIIALLTAAYGSSLTLINRYDPSQAVTDNVVNVMGSDNTSDVVDDLVAEYQAAHPDASERNLLVIALVDEFVNSNISSSSATTNLLKIINNFIGSKFNLGVLLLMAGFLLKVLYSVFIAASLQQGEKRFFLEARHFNNTKIPKLFYLFRLRRVRHSAAVLLKKWIFTGLWYLTIIGGVIKHYQYLMIPYILAENPEVSSKDAFALSKEMMKGNKWHAFLLSLSFIGWNILGVLTLGLLEIFYINPYRAATYAELYMRLRKDRIENDSPLKGCFEDIYLEPTPEFVAENGGVYPYEKYVVPQVPRRPINAKRKYTVTSIILLFFIFSFVGWAYEVSIHLVTDGVFVNRGTMFGPWLPIYGSGGVLVLIFMRRWMDKPIFTFFATMVICSVVEYFTSWYLEFTKGIRWWDYSGYFMNLNGRICLLGATVFGLGGCAFLYYIAPRLDDMLCKIPKTPKVGLCVVLLSLFGVDGVYSSMHPNTGAGITDYGYVELDVKKNDIYTAKASGLKRLNG